MRARLSLLLCAACVCLFALANGAAGQSEYVGATGGNYDDGNNWSPAGVPSAVPTFIRNGVSVDANAAEPSVSALWIGGPTAVTPPTTESRLNVLDGALITTTGSLMVGNVYDGAIYQSGGSVSAPYFQIGNAAGGHGTYALSGGSFISPGAAVKMYVGSGGTGAFIQTGGYFNFTNLANETIVGNGIGSYGTFRMTNGSMTISGDSDNRQFVVGNDGGRGSFHMIGGNISAPYKFYTGYRGTGVFVQDGGTIVTGTASGTTSDEFAVGMGHNTSTAGTPAYGEYYLKGGLLNVGSKFRIGSDGNSAINGFGHGVFTMSGGSLQLSAEPMVIGYRSSRGTFNFSGGQATVSEVYLADATRETAVLPSGVINVTGGSFVVGSSVLCGRTGYGEINVSAGTMAIGGDVLPTNSLRVGENQAGASGVVNVSGSGVLDIATNLQIGYNKGRGTLNISGGSVNVGYKTSIGLEATDANSVASGVFNMTGGIFTSPYQVYVGFRGSVSPGVKGELNITGGSFLAGQIRLLDECSAFGAGMSSAKLKVGADAYVYLNDNSAVEHFGIYDTGSAVEMEVASGKNSKVTAVGYVNFGTNLATLAVNRTSTSYRPTQGQTFTMFTSEYGTVGGTFASISSNIPGQLHIDPNDLNSAFLPVFRGAISADGNDYEVTFQGARVGDATGDNRVNSGDLSKLTGAWGSGSGQTWGDGDFTGEGGVNSGDLSLLTGNWGWSGPYPAPPAIPEPATLALLGLGGLALIRRKR